MKSAPVQENESVSKLSGLVQIKSSVFKSQVLVSFSSDDDLARECHYK